MFMSQKADTYIEQTSFRNVMNLEVIKLDVQIFLFLIKREYCL